MKTNFQIKNNHAIIFQGRHFDLHNNFDLISYYYEIKKRQLILIWKKSKGDWVGINESNGLELIHSNVHFLVISDRDIESSPEDDSCISDISFFPSSEREINDSIINRPDPDEEDDIIYFLENGQYIRVRCNKITLQLQ